MNMNRTISLTINGETHSAQVPTRMSLVDFLRDELGLTGTHVGCEHGVCGACTLIMDGEIVRGCLVLAVQAEGSEVLTIEGVEAASGDDHLLIAAGDAAPFIEMAGDRLARLLHDPLDGVHERGGSPRPHHAE